MIALLFLITICLRLKNSSKLKLALEKQFLSPLKKWLVVQKLSAKKGDSKKYGKKLNFSEIAFLRGIFKQMETQKSC